MTLSSILSTIQSSLQDLLSMRKKKIQPIQESNTEVVEIPILDLKLICKIFLRNEYHLTKEQLRSVEFKYMIRDYEFAGIKCEFKKGKDER